MDAFAERLLEKHRQCDVNFPDKQLATLFMDTFFALLFVPARNERMPMALAQDMEECKDQLRELIAAVLPGEEQATKAADTFFKQVPAVYDTLLMDAAAVLEFDPAAESIEEVMIAYPGFFATAVYRFSHLLWRQGVRILPRLLAEHAHSKTGIDIHPAARIGTSFFIDHGTGVVIGETAELGNHVKIYQGVTLGALSVSKDLAKFKRHPTIEDNVVIYSGATILGGETVIGANSLIGGNVWITASVPANSIVYHKSEVSIRDKNPSPDVLNFVI